MLPRTHSNLQRQLILDCDPGIDDAVAIALTLASPESALRAISTSTGNESPRV